MQLIPSRRAAALAGVALATVSLPLVATATSASAADPTSVTKDLTYLCDFSIPNDPTPADPNPDPLVLGDLPTGVKVSFTAPALQAGGTIAPTDIDIDLTMFDGLGSAAKGIFGAYAADGASTNTVLTVTSAEGAKKEYPIPSLSAPKTDLPPDDQPWIVAASGQSPEIAVPNTSSITLSAPSHFDITATLYTRDGTTQAEGAPKTVSIACDVDTATTPSLEVAKLAVAAAPDPTDPTPDPTDDPTDDPTTQPTDPSTGDPTDGTDDGVSDGNGQIDPVADGTPAATNGALPNTGAPNGLVALGALAVALLLGGAGLAGRRVAVARHRG